MIIWEMRVENMLVSIVIPCYNSEATIRKVVEMVMEEFQKMEGYDCEFVLVNDCSKAVSYTHLDVYKRQE